MNFKSITKNAGPAVGVGLGQIGGAYVGKFIPTGNEKIKAAATFVLGLVMAGAKNKMVQHVGLGLAGSGVAGLGKSFGIGGDDTMIAAPDVLIQDVEDGEINGPADGQDLNNY